MPDERRTAIEKLLQKALKHPHGGHDIRKRLEQDLSSDEAQIVAVPGPQGGPVLLHLRRYWDVDAGYRRNGIFDPEASLSDLPLMRSDRVFEKL